MTLRPDVIRERLRMLRTALRNLNSIKKVPRSRFVADFRHHWLAERGLQLAAASRSW